ALDDVDAEVVEQPGHPELVGHGELEADLLAAVAQGGVVGLYVVFGGHACQRGSSCSWLGATRPVRPSRGSARRGPWWRPWRPPAAGGETGPGRRRDGRA